MKYVARYLLRYVYMVNELSRGAGVCKSIDIVLQDPPFIALDVVLIARYIHLLESHGILVVSIIPQY